MTNPIMKSTLSEKPALMPETPPSPATLEGSLHPGHANTDGAKPRHSALSSDRNLTIKQSELSSATTQETSDIKQQLLHDLLRSSVVIAPNDAVDVDQREFCAVDKIWHYAAGILYT